MKKLLLLLLPCLFCILAFAQNWDKILRFFAPKYQHLYVDQIGNCYTSNLNEIRKFDLIQKQQQTYTDRTLGEISYVDVSNALKPLVLYSQSNSLAVLDSKLALNTKVDLNTVGIGRAMVLCNSYNDCIWIYDLENFELKRLNSQYETVNRSGNLALLLGRAPTPVALQEFGNQLFMADSVAGIVIFDVYATYMKTIPVKKIKSFQIAESKIFYKSAVNQAYIFATEINNFNLDSMLLPKRPNALPYIDVKVLQQKLYTLTEDSLVLYFRPE